MNKAYNLDFRVRGVSRLNKSADALNNHADALRNNARAMGQWQAANGGSAGPGGGGPGGGGPRRAQAPPMSNPAQALQHYAPGTRQYNQAIRMMNRSGAPNFGQSLSNLIMSTRFGAGGVSPLVGRSMQLLGSMFGKTASQMMMLAAPITAAVAAITALAVAAMAASRMMMSFAKDRARGGGTAGQTFAGMRLNEAFGVDSFSDARRLQETLAGGGVGASIMRGMGIRGAGGFARDPNAMNTLFATLKGLRGQKDPTFALQELGLEGYAPLVKYGSDAQMKRALNQSGGMSKSDIRSGIDLQLAIGDVQVAFKRLSTILTPIIERLAIYMRIVGQISRATTLLIKTIEWAFYKLVSLFGGKVPKAGGGPHDALDKIDAALDKWDDWLNGEFDKMGGGSDTKDNTRALDANTRGIQANTQAIRAMFGGDAGARGAVPDAWRFRMLGEARMQRQTAALGPFYEW